MIVHRILHTSFFEWCILWIVTFLSGVTVFVLNTNTIGSRTRQNHKLPGWPTNEPATHDKDGAYASASGNSRQYSSLSTTNLSKTGKCDPYGLVTANSLSTAEAFARLASKDRIIILSYVDMGYIEMAENFIETSIVKFNITNVLFFSISRQACERLESEFCAACLMATADGNSEQLSAFGSTDFINKMNIRTRLVHAALNEGYAVVHTDTDVVFLQNPLDDLQARCDRQNCDVAPLWDFRSHNAGFIFVHPTENARKLYARMIELAETFPNIDDQRILNAAIEELSTEMPTLPPDVQAELQGQEEEEFVDPDKLENMDAFLQKDETETEKPEVVLLKVISLPSDKYLSGQEYFVQGQRHFAGDHPCRKCVVVHNNWLVEKSSKIWRFKENHMWMKDTNGYYSNPKAKYLTIVNHISVMNDATTVEDFEEDGEEFEEKQKALLENGFRLARSLNRTLILPKMFINRFSPPLPAWLAQEKLLPELIERYGIQVRESTFLKHPKVPLNIKKSTSVAIKIAMTELSRKEIEMVKRKKLLQYRPRNNVLGPNRVELKNWFGDSAVKVLRFDSVWEDLKLIDKPGLRED